MKMKDIDEFENENQDGSLEDQNVDKDGEKMMALIQQMQQEAMKSPNNQQNDFKPAQILNVKTDNANYWDIVNIPTKYRLYPEGTKITARPLKVLEVKKLTSMNDENAEYVIQDILRKCVRGINIDELYSADKIYLIFWLRANSFRDNRYVVDFRCSKCESESNYHFDIDNVDVNYIKDDYNPNKIITLDNGDEITLGMLKIKDEIEMDNFKERYYKLFENSDGIDDSILNLSFLIDTINGAKLDSLQKYNYCIDVLTPQDFSTITTYLADNNVGVNPIMTVKCNKCGGESLIGITFRPDFFLPQDSAK